MMPKIKVILCLGMPLIQEPRTYVLGNLTSDGVYEQYNLYREDLIRFKKVTTNKIVVMGKNTWKAIESKPLPNRTNVVITSKPDDVIGALTFSSIKEVMDYFKETDELFFIGGAKLIETLQEEYTVDEFILTFVIQYAIGNIKVKLDLTNYEIAESTQTECVNLLTSMLDRCYFTRYTLKN